MHKPKLILHIGHGKTGTTSIQNFFVKKNKDLLKRGYLYPIRHSPRNNHVVLRAAFLKTEYMAVHDHEVYGGNTAWFKKDAHVFFKSLGEDIEYFKPHTVILSAEQMFRDFSLSSKISLADFLSSYFSDVLIVAYIKSPIAAYLSQVSQLIRTGVNSLSLKNRPIKDVIKYYERLFPGKVKLHAFERQQLVQGDVLYDFLTRYVPDALSLLKGTRNAHANISLSWSLLLMLRKLRMQVQPKGKAPLMQTRALLAWAAHKKKYSLQSNIKPKLKVEVSDYLVQTAIDFLWLRETYGIVFSDIDYEIIGSTPVFTDDMLKKIDIDNILDVSAIDTIEIDVEWYQKKGIVYYMAYFLFVLRLRWKRISNLYFRGVLSL